jgi:hypothetical protein
MRFAKPAGSPVAAIAAAARPSGVAHSAVRLLAAAGVMRTTWMAVIVALVLAQKLLPANITIGDTPMQ